MGFARFVLGKTNTLAGTPDYMAPEMIDFPHSHDMNVDWWALGILTFELVVGQCHPSAFWPCIYLHHHFAQSSTHTSKQIALAWFNSSPTHMHIEPSPLTFVTQTDHKHMLEYTHIKAGRQKALFRTRL